MKTDAKRPVTAALGRLRGEYITDFNMLAAGAIMAALTYFNYFLRDEEAVRIWLNYRFHKGLENGKDLE
jgi:hypothetical protein